MAKKELISELQKTKRFMGSCPKCFQEFHLADAILFSIDEKIPEAALAVVQSIRNAIKDRREELALAKQRMTTTARNTAQAVNLGKIVEKIVPSFSSFEYTVGDCRALFEPIDYVIFSGLTGQRQIDAIYFVDVKTGSARLAPKEQSIKDAVVAGAVQFKYIKS